MLTRVQLSLIATVFFIGGIGLIRPKTHSKINLDADFHSHKILEKGPFDVVLAGDSRTLYGLSPSVMNKIHPNLRIYNFAFPNAPCTKSYLDDIEKRIDLASSFAAIVYGVTPRGLTINFVDNNHFLKAKKMASEKYLELKYGEGMSMFSSIAEKSWNVHPAPSRERMFFKDGSILATRFPTQGPLYSEKKILIDHSVSSDIEEYFFMRVQRWTKKGIGVYGFFPPTSVKMRALDDKFSDLDKEDFIKRFESAGGIWIDVNPDGYFAPDQSHLDPDSAERLSKCVSKAMFQKTNLKDKAGKS